MGRINTDNITEIYKESFQNSKIRIPFGAYGAPWNYIKKYITEDRNAFILDAGCGNGSYSYQLAKDNYKNIYANDLFNDINTQEFVYSKSSIDDLSYENVFFDFIYSLSVIYYLNDQEKGIKELSRVLKSNGLFILTVYTKCSIPTFITRIKRKLGLKKHLENVTFLNAKNYVSLLENNGFEIVLMDGYLLFPTLYKLYLIFVRSLYTIFKIDITLLDKPTKSRWLAKIKSKYAYHSIIIARKK